MLDLIVYGFLLWWVFLGICSWLGLMDKSQEDSEKDLKELNDFKIKRMYEEKNNPAPLHPRQEKMEW